MNSFFFAEKIVQSGLGALPVTRILASMRRITRAFSPSKPKIASADCTRAIHAIGAVR